jgi:hypothetical protein
MNLGIHRIFVLIGSSVSLIVPCRSQVAKSVTATGATLGGYLEQVHAKSQRSSTSWRVKLAQKPESVERSWAVAERLLAQIRHGQHHVEWMNGILRRKAGVAPGWNVYKGQSSGDR